MGLLFTLTRSAGVTGPVCSTAMTCRVWLGPTTSSKAASAIRTAACCGRRANRASHSVRCNAKVRGNSCHGPRQRPSYSRWCVKSQRRSERRKGSALLSIANDSACRADPLNKLKLNLINCVRGGRCCKLQAQGDFCATALKDRDSKEQIAVMEQQLQTEITQRRAQ